MNRILIVSNRLPVQISSENEKITVTPSVGGLATGMQSIYKTYDSLWIGWPGLSEEELTPVVQGAVNEALRKEKCVPVYLTYQSICE